MQMVVLPQHPNQAVPSYITGVKLEDAEVRSVASNQSETEFSSLHDVVSRQLSLFFFFQSALDPFG